MNRPTSSLSALSVPQTPLNPADLDGTVAEAVRETMDALLGDAEPPTRFTDDTRAKDEWEATRKKLKTTVKLPLTSHIAGQTAGWILWLSLLWLLITFMADAAREAGFWDCIYPLVSVATGFLGTRWASKEKSAVKKHKTFLPETLSLVLPLLDRKNAMQNAYTDALSALLKQQAAWGQAATQNVLHDLKSLLQTGTQTAERKAEIEQAMNHQSLAELEADAARLADRVQTATDPTARETFTQSLALFEARLNRAASLEPLRQQLEAQEEVIKQALFEAQSSLSGASLSHWALAGGVVGNRAADLSPSIPLAHLGDTVSRLRQQTDAVEQAVREVMVVGNASGGR